MERWLEIPRQHYGWRDDQFRSLNSIFLSLYKFTYLGHFIDPAFLDLSMRFMIYMRPMISMISMISMILSVLSWFPFVGALLRSFSGNFLSVNRNFKLMFT